MRIFLAGAAGAIGRRLIPLLLRAGHEVTGTTRSRERFDQLRNEGVKPVLLEVLDAAAVNEAVKHARPDVVIHQLTSLPHDLFRLDPQQMQEALKANALVRAEGARNLIAAARESGVRRLVAQSIAWVYASGRLPHVEDDPLDLAAQGAQGITVQGVVALEQSVLAADSGIAGLILRYGWLYGPGTGHDTSWNVPPLHVDAGASAASLALEGSPAGIYNIVEDNPYASNEKAKRVLGWNPESRL
jgi:nucleoside-diphosphate-sugar epimerase